MRLRAVTSAALAAVLVLGIPAVAHADDSTVRGRVLVDGVATPGLVVGIVSAKFDDGCPSIGNGFAAVTDSNGDFSLWAAPSTLPTSSFIGVCGGPLGYTGAWVGPTGSGIETLGTRHAPRPFTRAQLAALTSPITIDAASPGRIRLDGLGSTTSNSVKVLTAGAPDAHAFVSCERKPSCTSNPVPAGQYRLRVQTSDTSGEWTSGPITVHPGATTTVAVPARASVTGHVHVSGGAKGQRYAVAVTPASDPNDPWSIDAKRDGTYRLPDLFPGRYAVQVLPGDSQGARGVVPRVVDLTVTAGERRQLDLREHSGTSVRGTVSGLEYENQQYFARLFVTRGLRTVQTGSASSRTSRTAPMVLPGVPRGDYTLITLAGDRMSRTPLRVSVSGTRRLAAPLQATGKALHLSGRVQGVRSGWVGVESIGGSGSGGSASIRNGRYTVTGLIPGRYRIVVHAFRRVDGVSTITLRHTAKRTLAAGPAYVAVTARLRDGVGPVSGAWVVAADPTRISRAVRSTSSTYQWPATTASGRVTLYLAPGRYDTGFFVGTRQNPNEFQPMNPVSLRASAVVPFVVRSAPIDLGEIRVAAATTLPGQ